MSAGQAALESAVVPFAQVGVDDHSLGEAGQVGRFRGARQGAGEDEPERRAGQPPAEGTRLLATGVGERDVGAAGMAAETRPFGLAVADEPGVLLRLGDPGRRGRRGLGHAVGNAMSGRSSSAASAAKNSRGRQPKSGARRAPGTWAMRVL